MTNYRLNIVFIFSIIFSLLNNVLLASTISPKTPVHESITRSAKNCFDNALLKGEKIKQCKMVILGEDHHINMDWIKPAEDEEQNFFVSWFKDPLTIYPSLEKAVRWPDEPTNDINAVGIVKFGAKMLSDCNVVAKQTIGGKLNINSGLLCNSHFGDMQFMHAQASSINEPAIDTYQKIFDWAQFLFSVASGHMSELQMDTNYCDFFKKDTLFHRSMLPGQNLVPCDDSKSSKWKLTTLFTFNCPNPFSSKNCYEISSFHKYDKSRIYATGALLHLIQDSFSQSHTERGRCEVKNKKVLAKAECLPITTFTTYKNQENHADADRMPIFAKSCESSTTIDDPITASAKALWHIHHKSKLEDFMSDFYRVFGKEDDVIGNIRNAELGQCFVKKL
ncbi:hypothetical protein [Aliikangiella sp. IMCC44359]|uniref:hypothetical protein n=1 Tax=Aliikangiella sp. IMCC44359 TaxID=3459125 RepID=UPI00403A9426